MKNEFNLTVKDNTWCPGCGNFTILKGMEEALDELGYKPKDVLFVSGIGQAAKLPHYINGHGLNALHGRSLPAAMGAHIANHNLLTIVNTGDGDNFSEGGNHFIHAIRRNLNMVHLIHDNQVYGLTKGQGSPTTPLGRPTSVYQEGVRVDPINPIEMALGMGASFIARTFSGDINHFKKTLKAAINHEGYAIVDVMQPCPSFNKVNTYQWYKERIYDIDGKHDYTNKQAAYEVAKVFGDEGVPLGIIYKEDRPHYLSKLSQVSKPLVEVEFNENAFESILDSYK